MLLLLFVGTKQLVLDTFDTLLQLLLSLLPPTALAFSLLNIITAQGRATFEVLLGEDALLVRLSIESVYFLAAGAHRDLILRHHIGLFVALMMLF